MCQMFLTSSLFTFLSRSASLPITFRVMDEVAKKSQRISRFILPIGTINMDGTALYLPCAVIFLAQINNIYLGFGEIFTIG